jgi:Ca2+-binding EF-hand superfamily protein
VCGISTLAGTHAQKVFREMDQDGDGNMSLDEFISHRHLLGLKTLNLEQAKQMFNVVDVDGSGHV